MIENEDRGFPKGLPMAIQAVPRVAADGSNTQLFDVNLEGVVFTLVDVHEGHDEQFDQWYETDHFYAGGVLGPSVLSGRRWYASKALREARFVNPDCLLDEPHRGTNLATYLLTTGGLQRFFDWVRPQVTMLRSQGRMFADRTHVNTDGYRLEGVLGFPGASHVPLHVALDHPFPGLFVAYLEPDNTAVPDTSTSLPDGILALSLRPNAGSFSAASIGVSEKQPGMQFPTNGEPVRMVLAFMPTVPEPSNGWATDLTKRLALSTGSRALWGGGFLPVVPGSSTHLSQLR